jgi:hypothetical protein
MSEKKAKDPFAKLKPQNEGVLSAETDLRRAPDQQVPHLTGWDVDVGCGYFESVANTTSRTHSPASVAGIVPAVIYW